MKTTTLESTELKFRSSLRASLKVALRGLSDSRHVELIANKRVRSFKLSMKLLYAGQAYTMEKCIKVIQRP